MDANVTRHATATRHYQSYVSYDNTSLVSMNTYITWLLSSTLSLRLAMATPALPLFVASALQWEGGTVKITSTVLSAHVSPQSWWQQHWPQCWAVVALP